MTKHAYGQGYSAISTDAQIIHAFRDKYGYDPVGVEHWVRNDGCTIVPLGDGYVTIKEVEDGTEPL
jgi:hypothetical protein